MKIGRRWMTALLTAGLAGAAPRPLAAHPGGHVSVLVHATLTAGTDGLAIDYVVHLGEMLTLGLGEPGAPDPSGAARPSDASAEAYRAARADEWVRGLAVELDGRPVAVAPSAGSSRVLPGIGPFSTVRFLTAARGGWSFGPGPHTLTYRDGNFAELPGHRQVALAAGAGVRILSSLPAPAQCPVPADFPTGPGPLPDVREASAELRCDGAVPLSAGAPIAPVADAGWGAGLLAALLGLAGLRSWARSRTV